LKTRDVQMSSNPTLFHENAIQGKTWRFDNIFSSNRLQNTISQSNVISELEDMLRSRLEHTRPTPVTGCMVVVSRDHIELLRKGNQICIFGYVQCKVTIKITALNKWIPDCDWQRLHGGLYDNDDFRRQIADPNFIQIKVYQELKLQNNTGRKAAKVRTFTISPHLQISKFNIYATNRTI